MLAEISAGLSSLKAAKDIVQGLNAVASQAAINELKINLQGHILEAHAALFAAQQQEAALLGRIADLEQQIVSLKDWSAEKERYELVPIWGGSVAYMPKLRVQSGEPPHWLCANCFNQGCKSFMQFQGHMGMDNIFACAACKGTLRARGAVPAYLDDAPEE